MGPKGLGAQRPLGVDPLAFVPAVFFYLWLRDANSQSSVLSGMAAQQKPFLYGDQRRKLDSRGYRQDPHYLVAGAGARETRTSGSDPESRL